MLCGSVLTCCAVLCCTAPRCRRPAAEVNQEEEEAGLARPLEPAPPPSPPYTPYIPYTPFAPSWPAWPPWNQGGGGGGGGGGGQDHEDGPGSAFLDFVQHAADKLGLTFLYTFAEVRRSTEAGEGRAGLVTGRGVRLRKE
jgi:hypothetical protein